MNVGHVNDTKFFLLEYIIWGGSIYALYFFEKYVFFHLFIHPLLFLSTCKYSKLCPLLCT